MSRTTLLLSSTVALAAAHRNHWHDWFKGPDTRKCLYPVEMPDPVNAQLMMTRALIYQVIEEKWETPVVVRAAHISATCSWNCVAAYDDAALDTNEHNWLKGASADQKTSETRALCNSQCWNTVAISQAEGASWNQGLLSFLFSEWGLYVEDAIRPEITTCGGDRACLLDVAHASGFDPLVVGQIIADETNRFFADDGWNADGSLRFSKTKGEAVPVTANPTLFEDTTGYQPVNFPGATPDPIGDEKYIVEGIDRRWQPLRDLAAEGYSSLQEHVTPHIGEKAHHYIERDYKQLRDPEYEYRQEALDVVGRLKALAQNPLNQAKVKFFDNKLFVRGAIQAAIKAAFPSQHTYEEQMLFIYSISVAEYEAMLQAWYNKVQFDLVRPTTVIKRWGDDVLTTLKKDADGSVSMADIAARDFEAHVRTMPHSEFPSGSACLCTAYAEFTNAFIADAYNATKPLGPLAFPVAPELTLAWADIDQYAHECGQSRLWGGMHFSASVPAAIEACTGIGADTLQLTKRLRNRTDYSGNTYLPNAPRPVLKGCDVDNYATEWAAEGDACQKNSDCSKRFYCEPRKKECTLLGVEGDWCNRRNPCESGLKCKRKTCISK